MTKAGEVSRTFQRALPQPPPSADVTTRVPDCGTTSLGSLGEVAGPVLKRMLPSGRRGPGFNSSI
jgi:hypothetical protein